MAGLRYCVIGFSHTASPHRRTLSDAMNAGWLLDLIPDWAQGWAIVLAAALVGTVVHALLYSVLRFVVARNHRLKALEGALLDRSRRPTGFVFPLLAARASLALTARLFEPETTALLALALDSLIILSFTWLLVKVTFVLEDVAKSHFDITVADNLEARQARTRIVLLRRLLTVIVALLGVSILLLQFQGFRVVGTGILASAGIAGIVIGIAAQRPIGNLLAGVQIAITQPFRVDDVVIVEGEWGRIEEVTLSYVVVNIWDQRRLVLPISYFLEKPFQNWTRTSSSLLGTVFLYVDYNTPVDALRDHLHEIVRDHPLWDKRVCVLQVTDATERTLQIRALVSAADAGRAFDLRCEVRERLAAFLRDQHPEALPRFRTEVGSEGDGRTGAHVPLDA